MSDWLSPTKVVHKIEEGEDRRQVACTTYQMRNPFRQFSDAMASELDEHCYWQHAYAADLCPRGGRVLDVCCGRGLLIPFLRYRAKPVAYVGVDVKPENAAWRDGADPRRPAGVRREEGWGFPTLFVEAMAHLMEGPVRAATEEPFDLVVYTSSIEHMQPEAQRLSLGAARRLARAGAALYLTCPVTEPGRDGYEARYAAHVYEPSLVELRRWLGESGWAVESTAGLCTSSKVFKARLRGPALTWATRVYDGMPREQALCAIAAVWPETATEAGLVCRGV